jgi:hypothetical protein
MIKKKLLIIFLLTLSVSAFCQHAIVRTDLPAVNVAGGSKKPVIHSELPIVTKDWKSIEDAVIFIAQAPKRHYTVSEIDTLKDYKYFKATHYKFILSATDGSGISIVYRNAPTGFEFADITGNQFDDMFAVWKTFFEPEANAEMIAGVSSSERGSWMPIDTHERAMFNVLGGAWTIHTK